MTQQSLSFSQRLVFSICLCLLVSQVACTEYNVSKANVLGRRFDGFGALSGGGCTSRLLPSYPNHISSQIFDYLFLPNYGASLQILKVEIGGDAQSTEGTEPSHSHFKGEENYNRGYQWWIMKEAKKRNPNIMLASLSWGFPRWLGEGGSTPWTNSTVEYIMNWLYAAKRVHNLTIDYAGVWNERGYSTDYIVALSTALRASNLTTKLIAHDESGPTNWAICHAMATDQRLTSHIDIIGSHYPGSLSDSICSNLTNAQSNAPFTLWSSEDYAEDWKDGGQCLARILNQNYVRGNMTAVIAWNLIAAFYDELAYGGNGLMQATQPWSGHYQVSKPLWVMAHHTQFVQPGWQYLAHNQGVGLLQDGGSYVSYTDGDNLAIVVELMDPATSQCHWGVGPSYKVAVQNITFRLDASFSYVKRLYMYATDVNLNSPESSYLIEHQPLQVNNGLIAFVAEPNMIYTLSTLPIYKSSQPKPAAAAPFPVPYTDDFELYAIDAEADYFFDQAGSWQIYQGASGLVMRQQVLQPPIGWCDENPVPYSVMGSHQWRNISVSADVLIETKGGLAFVAARVEGGGCVGANGSGGTVFGVSSEGYWALCNTTAFSAKCVHTGQLAVPVGSWIRLSLIVTASQVLGYVNGVLMINSQTKSANEGWAGIGSSWTYVQFDNFLVTDSYALLNDSPQQLAQFVEPRPKPIVSAA